MKTERNALKPNLEALEAREVMNVSWEYSLFSQRLTIHGTNAADKIRVQQTSNDGILVRDEVANRVVTTIDARLVGTVMVRTYGGNDVIDMRGVHKVGKLEGGSGNDQLYLGRAGGSLDGGDGDDHLSGSPQADFLWGGSGNDYLSAGRGRDKLYGSFGDDYVYGGDGNDTLYGEAGNDFLYGGGGDDMVRGGAGKDYLEGGSGEDILNGGADVDRFYRYETGFDTYFRNLDVNAEFNLVASDSSVEAEDEPASSPEEVTGAFLSDVRQTGSATCGFLSTLAALADDPSASADFESRIKYNPTTEQFGVTLYHKTTKYMTILGRQLSFGAIWERKEVWVDGAWTRGRDPGGKLWVTLYQKAYLELMNVQARDSQGRALPSDQWRSANLDWQSPRVAYPTLVGKQTAWVAGQMVNFAKMQSDFAANRLLAVSHTNAGESIPGAHCFVVKAVFRDAVGTEYIRLFNPWQKDDSFGSRFDIDANGNRVTANDGLFTITLAQFRANFRGYEMLTSKRA